MADIMVNHNNVDTLVDEMNHAAREMDQKFTDMMRQLSLRAQSFSGAAASAFGGLANQQGVIAAELGANFGTGANVLNNMHEAITDSDRRGAQILGQNG